MSALTVNSLLRYVDEENLIERIVWIAEDYSTCFVIDMDKNSFPFQRNVDDILHGLETLRIELMKNDKWIQHFHEETLSPSEIEIREKAWNIVSAIALPENEPFIFYSKERRQLINKVVNETGVSVSTVERNLKRFWKFGKTKNALLPDLKNCGAKGVERSESIVKRGRPSTYGHEGVNVTFEMKQIFSQAMERYYYKRNKATFQLTYQLMIKDFFLKGKEEKSLIDLNVPTFRQFYYWVQKERSIIKEISKRHSGKEYLLKHRPLLGNTAMETGSIGTFQIDATVADIYLTSKWDRSKIIGRPILYFCVDTYSHVIASYYIGMEGPSWIGAMMCLLNTVEDKVELCKRYGIDIKKEDWNVSHLPNAILADRGELLSKNAETIVENLGIRVLNTGRNRGDLKSQIEQQFRLINLFVKPMTPGTIDADKQSIGRDYRLDAKLNIDEYTKIIINCILYYNNSHRIKNFKRDEMLIRDDVESIPSHLWNWSMKNRAGMLKQLPLDICKLNLLPKGQATVSQHGIRFHGMYYSCRKAIEEHWYTQARSKGRSWKVDISYDPRNVGHIYLRGKDGKSFEVCRLLENQLQYDNTRLEDIIDLQLNEKRKLKNSEPEELLAKVDLLSSIQQIVKEATKEASMSKTEESKASRLKGIRQNRQEEKEMLRAEQMLELSEPIDDKADKGVETNDYFYDFDLIRSVAKGETS